MLRRCSATFLILTSYFVLSEILAGIRAENNSQAARDGRELILLQNLSFEFSVFQRFSFALCR